MPLSFCVDESGVGHSVGSNGARWNAGQTETCGAARTFTRDLNRRSTTGGGLGGECRGIQDGVRKPQSISVNDGVVVSGPNWNAADMLPPRAKESSPFATSL
jgi:hypothetical protein